MNALIITIGDEIISGARVDTNSAYIAKTLISIGIDVIRRTSVGDNREDILREINWGLEEHDLVVVTGGLGPTDDDITKEVICEAFDTRLVEHAEILEALKIRYQQLGMTVSDIARGLALQPEGATLLINPLGTAPGIVFERKSTVFCSLPGVPAEMKALVDEKVVPYLRKRGTGRVIIYREVSTYGIPESKIALRLKESGFEPKGVRVAYLPSYSGVSIRLRAEGNDEKKVRAILHENFSRVYDAVEEFVFSTESEDLVEVVAAQMRDSGATVSVAESCTGGLIAKMLTDVPGSSALFKQGIVAYANEAKIERLGVKPETLEAYGAVSEEVCREMATGMRETAGTDYALSTTGIAGPDGGTDEKPVGLVYLGIASAGGVEVRKRSFSGDRDVIRTRSAYTLLNLLRLKLLES
jgi:nicotinamide-nucleotide amidase